MCTTCGCGTESEDIDKETLEHNDELASNPSRRLVIEENLLGRNNQYAGHNRASLAAHCVTVLNLLSSPGSGKTTLLMRTLNDLKSMLNIAVIEGDQQTELDAQRIRETGVKALQINTGKGCHLDAHSVGHALEHIDLPGTNLVFIENVGNLVCPAAFDLGEQAKVTVLSVTEGDDKPLKYPDMFQASNLLLINKIDLLPYVDFNPEKAIEYAKRINPEIEVMLLSAKTGEGFSNWYAWLKDHCPELKTLPLDINLGKGINLAKGIGHAKGINQVNENNSQETA